MHTGLALSEVVLWCLAFAVGKERGPKRKEISSHHRGVTHSASSGREKSS